MRYSTGFRTALLMAIAALWMPRAVLANPIVPVSLAFESEGLDLDTGTVVPIESWTLAAGSADPQPDVVLGFNSERATHAVAFHNRMNGVKIAFLEGVAFNLVGSADLAGLSFTAELVDEAFGTGDSVVLRTDTGAYYLLGNPLEDASGVTFDTQLLDETKAGLVRPAAYEPETILARANVPPDEAPQSNSPALQPGLSIEDWRQIRGLIEEDGYRFQSVSEHPVTFVTRNADHGLYAELDGSGLRLSSSMDDDWDWSLTLTEYGYAGALRPAEVGEVVAHGNRLEHRRGELVEWYVNDGQGLEQGFTLAARPDGKRAEPLALRLASSGSLAPALEDGSGVRLVDGVGRTVLRYAGLLAWDATGRELPARLGVEAGSLTINVDDAGAVYPVTIDPTVVNEDAKLVTSDAAGGDTFGFSVAVSGDTVVVGAANDDDAGSTSGSAYVFVRDGTTWTEQAKLTASDASGGAPGDLFGWSVAVSGDTAVVGATNDDHAGGTNAGSAYVFVRSGTEWTEQAKLTASDAADEDRLGYSVAISGDTAVVGSNVDDHTGFTNAGSAYVFVRSGTSWSEQAKLTASDAATNDRFGRSVAVSGDTAVAGAFFDENAGGAFAGAAYVYFRSGTHWSEQAKLTASDAASSLQLGISVAASGDTIIAGALGDDHAGTLAGSAYVFVRSGTSWTEQAKLTASDAASLDLFGSAVAVSGDTVLVGAERDDEEAGSAYVFVRSGTTWGEQFKLTSSDRASGDRFGNSVALSGDTAVVGALLDDNDGGPHAGSAYVFELSSNQPPVALCVDVSVAAGSDCTADALIDAGSFDPDGDPITPSQEPPGSYELGDTLVTLTVTDDQGASASCTAIVTVEDTTPPDLAVTLAPDTLWPPNHHMIDVEGTVITSDNCDAPMVALASLTSNEADDAQGIGDGRTTADILPGADDLHFRLRAERAGTGSGRIYTAVYTATDGSGNVTSEAGFAVVPHDQGGVIDPVAIVLEEMISGTIVSWAVVPGAASYDVIRGHLDKLAETDVAINLGTVLCIKENSTDVSTLGHEDADLPAPRKAFFYLVEYYDSLSSTYGSESAGKPRAPGAGACQ